jgi:hypothetical protein
VAIRRRDRLVDATGLGERLCARKIVPALERRSHPGTDGLSRRGHVDG